MGRFAVVLALVALVACGQGTPATTSTTEPTPTGPTSTGTRTEEAAPTPQSPAPQAGETLPPERLGELVVIADDIWTRHRGGEEEELAIDAPALVRWRVLSTGAVVWQEDDRAPVMILPADAAEPRVLVEGPGELERRTTLIGIGRTGGQEVVLVGDGRARSLNDDDGTDIVAVDPDDGRRRILVPDAASAWEGAVSSAAAHGDVLVYHGIELVSGWVSVVDLETGERRDIRQFDPEADGLELVQVGLRRVDEANRQVEILLLTHQRAGAPDEPSAAVEVLATDGTALRASPVPGISWDAGLPASLSVGSRFLVVNRRLEQDGPAAAVAQDLQEDRWHEVDRSGVVHIG